MESTISAKTYTQYFKKTNYIQLLKNSYNRFTKGIKYRYTMYQDTLELSSQDTNLQSKIFNTNIERIKTKEEFKQVFENIISKKYWWSGWSGGSFWYGRKNLRDYESGLMPYAGLADVSYEINTFMRTGKLPSNSGLPKYKELVNDYIRLMDYSLRKLDKVYGNYSGIVFRYGFMDAKKGAKTLSYVSTSRTMEGAVEHCDKAQKNKYPYNVIYTKHGHRIDKMQKRLNYSKLYKQEKEILLEPGKTYKKIDILTPGMENLKNKFIKVITYKNKISPNKNLDIDFYIEI